METLRLVEEHNDLCKMVQHAMDCANTANTAETHVEYWDAWEEVNILREEVSETEERIAQVCKVNLV